MHPGIRRIALTALFAVVPALPVHAQAGTVVGLIHARFEDSTRLNDVVVTLTPGDRSARTDSLGEFRFVALTPGDYLLSARRLGYEVAFKTIHVSNDRETGIRIAMIPIAQRLSTINVSGRRVTYPVRLTEPYKRAERGTGHYITREQIDSLNALDLSAVLMRIPGIRARDHNLEFVRCTALGNLDQRIQVWVDGQRWTNYSMDRQRELMPGETMPPMEIKLNITAYDAIRDIPPSSVQLIELYAGPASIPGNYQADACAVILIWRK